MARFYLESDCERSLLGGKRVAVIGYGNQGRAQALNLRDNGLDVIVGLREKSPSLASVRSDGFSSVSIEEASSSAELLALLIPDEVHGEVFVERIAPYLKRGAALCFAHGLSIHYGLVEPRSDIDVFMVAPLGAGALLRKLYLERSGLPSYVAVHQDRSGLALRLALAYAGSAGCAKGGILETTFGEETEVDLFGEQAVLCGGIGYLLLTAFETLVDKGYQPEAAYMECVTQLKASAEMIGLVGLDGFADRISSPALYGMLTRGSRVVGTDTGRAMKELLDEIRSGEFVGDWRKNGTRTSPQLLALRLKWKSLRIQEVGRTLRNILSSQESVHRTRP
ncbi:MAG: ketol-acid reductoisomerase [Candidatus Eisenbacteria bacterium]